MALFENYDRRIDKINGVLKQYGIESVEACREMCQAKGARYLELAQGYVTRMALNDKNEIIAFEFLNLGKFTDAVKAGKTPEEAIAGAMGHYGQWENAAKYIDPRTDEETHSVASVFPVHE